MPGNISTHIRIVTARHSLLLTSQFRSAIGQSCDVLSQHKLGAIRGFHVPHDLHEWVRFFLFAGSTTSVMWDAPPHMPGYIPFWSKPVSTFGFLFLTTFIRSSHMLTIPFFPSASPPSCWQLRILLAKFPMFPWLHCPWGFTPSHYTIACPGRELSTEQQVSYVIVSSSVETVNRAASCRTE